MNKQGYENIPEWMRYSPGANEKSPVWFLDLRGTGFAPDEPAWQDRVNSALEGVLREASRPEWGEPVLVKCHIGEGRCKTRMLPEYARSTVEHFRGKGLEKIASGDTTVAYTGDRGYHANQDDCSRYLELAGRHGWGETGPLKTPFVVLDRPATSVEDVLEFDQEEVMRVAGQAGRFNEVYVSGGFDAAGTVVNHVHLTLHDLAQVACSVKGITMGGSSYKGKLIMHKCYSPVIDAEKCSTCGLCSRSCPEGALLWDKGLVPELEADPCIGCGECGAVCPERAIDMTEREVTDWERGSESLPYRMADYLVGMMEGKWDNLLNVVHMYNITRRCDCLDTPQEPILPHIGFLVGRNPFAVDLLSTRLLHEEAGKAGGSRGGPDKALEVYFDDYHGLDPYAYIRDRFGVVVEPEPVKVELC